MITIYFDLDGVLADFDNRVNGLFNIDISKVSFKEFGKKYKDDAFNNDEFFSKMKVMQDCRKMVKLAKSLGNVKILSAYGDINQKSVMRQKEAWVKKNFGNIPVILVRKSHMKAKFANNQSILIDDREEKSNVPFRSKGGFAIHHKNVNVSMKKLNEIFKSIK